MSALAETPSTAKRELVLTTLIAAPRVCVYRCWTEPDLLKQWFAPKPYTTPHAELDVRAGGSSYIVMRDPDGNDMPMRGVYLDIVKNERIVFTDAFTEAWQPSEKPFFIGIITLEDEGTRRAIPPAPGIGRRPTAKLMKKWAFTRAGGSAPSSWVRSRRSCRARATKGLGKPTPNWLL